MVSLSLQPLSAKRVRLLAAQGCKRASLEGIQGNEKKDNSVGAWLRKLCSSWLVFPVLWSGPSFGMAGSTVSETPG